MGSWVDSRIPNHYVQGGRWSHCGFGLALGSLKMPVRAGYDGLYL